MVVTAQMKHAVSDQKSEFAAGAVTVFLCLFPDAEGIDHDVTQLKRACVRVGLIGFIRLYS